jgi:hypothetical protein
MIFEYTPVVGRTRREQILVRVVNARVNLNDHTPMVSVEYVDGATDLIDPAFLGEERTNAAWRDHGGSREMR